MNYVTIKNGNINPIIGRKQLYYVSRWKTVFHQSFEEPTNISEQINIFNQLNNKITIPANTKCKLLITVKCDADNLDNISGVTGSGSNRFIELYNKNLLGYSFRNKIVGGTKLFYKRLTMFGEKTNILGMNIRNIKYNFDENNNVTVYENSNYVTTNTFSNSNNILEFDAYRLNQSYGGSFEYNPSILDIKLLTYQ